MQQGVTGSGTVVEEGGLFDEREREGVSSRERERQFCTCACVAMHVQVCDQQVVLCAAGWDW